MTNGKERVEEQTAVLADRYETLDPNQVLSVIPLMPYHEVADIGCGAGYFTIPLGKHLFDGRVYALDSDAVALEHVKRELERIRLTNVEVHQFEKGGSIPLRDGTLDGAFIAFKVHQWDDPNRMLAEVYRCLRRGGWVVVLEWSKGDLREGPPAAARIDVPELRGMFQEAGFRFGSRHDLNNRQYMLIMRK